MRCEKTNGIITVTVVSAFVLFIFGKMSNQKFYRTVFGGVMSLNVNSLMISGSLCTAFLVVVNKSRFSILKWVLRILIIEWHDKGYGIELALQCVDKGCRKMCNRAGSRKTEMFEVLFKMAVRKVEEIMALECLNSAFFLHQFRKNELYCQVWKWC